MIRVSVMLAALVFDARKWCVRNCAVAAAVGLVVLIIPTDVYADTLYSARRHENAEVLDMIAALDRAEAVLGRRWQCPELELDSVGWTCIGEQGTETRNWTETPIVSLESSAGVIWICARASDRQRCRTGWGVTPELVAMVYRGASQNVWDRVADGFPDSVYPAIDAMAYFSSAPRRMPRDASTDIEFHNAVSVAPSSVGVEESLRRVQVQAETAIRANRSIDAALLYRNMLRTAPSWADGHFNLGLLYGELKLYPEAITEMHRYLYLAPNSPEARAVQDRIYEWEVLLSTR